jgi:ubiquitin-protein ligase
MLCCAVLQAKGWKPSITVKQILSGIQVGHGASNCKAAAAAGEVAGSHVTTGL